MKKPTRVEIQLYDSLENMMQCLYADGPRQKDDDRCNRALEAFQKQYGNRHERKWEVSDGNKS